MNPEILTDAGFRRVCDWTLDGERISLSTRPPAGHAVYAFVVQNVVVYVGLTKNCLRRRMYGYQKGAGAQRTNVRVRNLIIDSLRAGQKIEVLAVTPDQTTWNGLPVDVSAGLEAGLIARFKPAWNMLGIKKRDAAV
jgi:hypothetical protein